MEPRTRNILLAVGGAVVLVIVIAVIANSGSDDSTTTTVAAATSTTSAETTTTEGTEETTTTTAAETTTTADAGFTPGPLGAVEVKAGEDIQIRTLQAISGEVAFLGIPNQRGSELAVEDFGAVKGFNVSLGTGLDDLCSAEGGQAAGQSIVAEGNVVGVIGTSCSGAATAASPLITGANMVLISPSNTSPSLTSDLQGTAGDAYSTGYYRTAHNDLFQGTAVADFVFNELGLTKAAAIHDGDPYTNGLAQAFATSFEALGGTITAFTAVNKGDTDMVPVLTEVAASEPEALYYPIFMPEGGFIAQQAGDVTGMEDVTMIGADGILTTNFLVLPETEGTYLSGPDLRFGENTSVTGVNATEFLARYEAAYGEAPSAAFWAHSYDATILLLTAIEAASVEQDGSLWIDLQGVRDALNAITGFAGITGSLTCDDFGDCGSQRISVVLHEDANNPEATVENVVYSYAP